MQTQIISLWNFSRIWKILFLMCVKMRRSLFSYFVPNVADFEVEGIVFFEIHFLMCNSIFLQSVYSCQQKNVAIRLVRFCKQLFINFFLAIFELFSIMSKFIINRNAVMTKNKIKLLRSPSNFLISLFLCLFLYLFLLLLLV